MKCIEYLCDICIESKHISIIKHKAITLTVRRLEEIYVNLWDLYNLSSILRKIYVGLLLDKYTQKSCVLLLRSKYEFFNTFKQWFFWAEALFKGNLGCLRVDGRRKFINNMLKLYCQKRSIKIGYVTLYIYKENKMAKRC